jgi:flagellar biosynthesis/type III secretory pathway chaperone
MNGFTRVLMPMHENPLKALESALVKEFRACQALYYLTQEEREALAKGDVLRLLALAEHKETLLDRLTNLSSSRQRQVAELTPLNSGEGEDAVVRSLKILDLDDELHLVTLFEGIQVIKAQVRELALGNRALAATALNRAASLQAGLVSSSSTSLPALFSAILAARDALDAQDRDAISAALGEIQNALAPDSDLSSIERSGRVAAVQAEPLSIRSEPNPPKNDTNMLEYMANLYRQEKAYKAVLKVSSRMLTSA